MMIGLGTRKRVDSWDDALYAENDDSCNSLSLLTHLGWCIIVVTYISDVIAAVSH